MYAHHNYYRNLNVDAQVSGREERESMSTPHPPRLTGRCPGCRRPIPCGCHLRIGRRLSWHYRVLPAAAWAIGSSNATAVTPPPPSWAQERRFRLWLCPPSTQGRLHSCRHPLCQERHVVSCLIGCCLAPPPRRGDLLNLVVRWGRR
jgi:hypothetical protein